MRSTKRLSNAAPVAMRMALAAGFLSAVADRFGLWGPIGTPGMSWGRFAKFLDDTATILPYLSTTLVAVAGWAATVAAFIRPWTLSESRGFYKTLVAADSDRILGFTAFAPEAGAVMTIVQTAMTARLPYTV